MITSSSSAPRATTANMAAPFSPTRCAGSGATTRAWNPNRARSTMNPAEEVQSPGSLKALADYGIDAPLVILQLITFGTIAISLGIAARAFLGNRQPWLFVGLFSGISMVLTALIMIWGSKVGKISLRERVLDSLQLRGDECVLDVGCGRGLFLLGAAKRLSTGKAIGVDLWR